MASEKAIATALAMLSSVYRVDISPVAAMGWKMALGDLADDELSAGVLWALKTSKFMPAASELIAQARPQVDVDSAANQAWAVVRAAMDTHDYTVSVDFGFLVNAVVRNLGGWRYLTDRSVPELEWDKKAFISAYKAMSRVDPSMLNGQYHRGALGGAPSQLLIGPQQPKRLESAERHEVLDIIKQLADDKSIDK